MYDNYNKQITLQEIADIIGLSLSRTSHFTKESLGISFSSFLQNIRLEHTLRLLKDSSKSILEISKECGFSNHKYLSKKMKDKFNMTPLQYRKLMTFQDNKCIDETNKTPFLEELQCCVHQIENDSKFQYLSAFYKETT